jgi:ABC-type branched-subunit amino acid transport system ATPase component/ABC-type branched-subunit amino acid transport system permease subunit
MTGIYGKTALILLAVAVTLAPFVLPSFQLFVLSLALVYTIAILGVNIVMGYAGQVSLGHAGFAAIGAYTTALLMTEWDIHYLVALMAGALLAAASGYLLAFPALKLGPVYVAMVTFGFGLVIFLIAQNWYELTNGPNGIVVPPPTLFGYPLLAEDFHIVIALFLIVFYWLARNLIRSSYGRAFVAIRDGQLAAEAMGVNLARYKTMAFSIGAFYAGLSGGLFAGLSQFVNPDAFVFINSILYVTMGILGGMGYLAGAGIGGAMMALLPELLRGAAEYKDFLTGLLLLLLLIFLPRGAMGLIYQTWIQPIARARPPFREALPARNEGGTRRAANSEVLLESKGLTKHFGGLRAVQDVSFQIRRGEILSLIGPNGAGKTTVFNLISGIHAPTAGKVFFEGRDITQDPPHARAALGIGRTFQNLELFGEMAVSENVLVGAHSRTHTNLFTAFVHTPAQQKEEAELEKEALTLLANVGLERNASERAESLSFGHQRLLEIARALASEPRLLLLDEPAAGLNSKETDALAERIRRARDELGIAILLIGHTMRLVMSLSDRIVVLDQGQKIADGVPAAIRTDTRVVEAYLGATVDA